MNKIFDIIVIGAGSSGLVVAIGRAKAGKKVLFVEKNNYGGDCRSSSWRNAYGNFDCHAC